MRRSASAALKPAAVVYCGIVSGKKVDKGALFKTFFGKLKTAPMIEECPVNMECQLVRTVDFPTHDIFMGEVVNTFCDEAVLTVNTVPEILTEPANLIVSPGIDTNFVVVADGPALAYAWERNGQPVPAAEFVHGRGVLDELVRPADLHDGRCDPLPQRAQIRAWEFIKH